MLSNPDFCQTLIADPEKTLAAHGVTATPEILGALANLDAASVQRLVGAFGRQEAAAV